MMTGYVLLPASLLITVLTVSSVLAQRPATPPARTTTPQTNVAIPTSKLAVIYSDSFLDSKTGIAKFAVLVATLNREFQKQKDDLVQIQQRAQQLQTEIQQAAPGTERLVQTKTDQLQQLKTDLQRKGEDGQTAFNKRRTELFAPLQEEIGRALEVFAKARSINLIIDGTQVPMVYAADSIDITRPFINDFNNKNPVTATTAPPRKN